MIACLRVCPASIRGRALLIALSALSVGLWSASSAAAIAPTGDYAVFSQCPRFTSGVVFCVYARVEGGEVALGKVAVPVSRPIVLQGGTTFNEQTEAETFVGALDGNTLSRTPQSVPGGLLGLVSAAQLPALIREWFQRTVGLGLTRVTGTVELAKPAGAIGVDRDNVVNEQGIGLVLPVRIHLENPFLGGDCYIGSSTNPITWSLTTGLTAPPPPNTPIKGSVGDLELADDFKLNELFGATLVDNSYAVPAANGCGGSFSPVLDPVIDAKVGLPSPAGHNTVILRATIKNALTQTVVGSER